MHIAHGYKMKNAFRHIAGFPAHPLPQGNPACIMVLPSPIQGERPVWWKTRGVGLQEEL
jgi:hypothetical protein